MYFWKMQIISLLLCISAFQSILAQCVIDGGDPSLKGDGNCDCINYNSACGFDDGDCSAPADTLTCGCLANGGDPPKIGDGHCDCLNAIYVECASDDGDCTPEQVDACFDCAFSGNSDFVKLGDGVCDASNLINPDCSCDFNDCTPEEVLAVPGAEGCLPPEPAPAPPSSPAASPSSPAASSPSSSPSPTPSRTQSSMNFVDNIINALSQNQQATMLMVATAPVLLPIILPSASAAMSRLSRELPFLTQEIRRYSQLATTKRTIFQRKKRPRRQIDKRPFWKY